MERNPTNQKTLCPNERFTVSGSLNFAYVLPEDAQDGKLYQCEQRNPITDVKMGGKLNHLAVAAGKHFFKFLLDQSPL